MLGLGALVLAAIFFGAAIYINIAEHPARLKLGDGAALAQWEPAYKRGYAMQASLAIASGLLGLAAWWTSGQWLWGAGAAVMMANWPYTLVVIMPVNHQLEATAPADASAETRALLIRWGWLHAGRSALGGIAMIIFLDVISMRM
ncbi:DUF1772 domain-containing protein [Plastoroseomonas arctica]|uniref:DUF1772 domain-containing protein n=1 Tax=Plastoroseomonas arctica TaxID=1509237 RepID=A0AAF1JXF2_9PROT|nr:DUF1772 domain-containing protein [Plastoroseomonas arctica]MBR0655637.1 DUF1772 domain-containing protein [Plastoroseomonas arctica]